jgi:hypothetical protein
VQMCTRLSYNQLTCALKLITRDVDVGQKAPGGIRYYTVKLNNLRDTTVHGIDSGILLSKDNMGKSILRKFIYSISVATKRIV